MLAELLDQDVVNQLSDCLWLMVLSEKQESLLISDEDRSLVLRERALKGLI